jgi:transposase
MGTIQTSRTLVPTGKARVGRPTKYTESFCERVIELGSAGKSKAQIAAALGVSRQTLDNWAEEHPEFLDAIKYARDLALAWWEDRGQEGLFKGKSFNALAYIFQMKNRFREDYGDRTENTHKMDASELFIAFLRDRVTPKRGVPLRAVSGDKK